MNVKRREFFSRRMERSLLLNSAKGTDKLGMKKVYLSLCLGAVSCGRWRGEGIEDRSRTTFWKPLNPTYRCDLLKAHGQKGQRQDSNARPVTLASCFLPCMFLERAQK